MGFRLFRIAHRVCACGGWCGSRANLPAYAGAGLGLVAYPKTGLPVNQAKRGNAEGLPPFPYGASRMRMRRLVAARRQTRLRMQAQALGWLRYPKTGLPVSQAKHGNAEGLPPFPYGASRMRMRRVVRLAGNPACVCRRRPWAGCATPKRVYP